MMSLLGVILAPVWAVRDHAKVVPIFDTKKRNKNNEKNV